MKKCPICQATFGDEKKFCQKDGTPLVEVFETIAPPEDPFKTVVATSPPTTSPNISEDPMKTTVISADDKDNDLLQLPEVFDPMKTVVVSEPMKFNEPSSTPPPSEPVVPAPEPPKFNEPNLSPPTFGDLSKPPRMEEPYFSNPISEPPKMEEPPVFSAPPIEPPKAEPIPNPFSPPPIEIPKVEAIPPPTENAPSFGSPFDKPASPPIPSPFDQSLPPPPTFNEPKPMKVEESVKIDKPQPFGNSPFDPPAPTFGQPSNDPFNQPVQSESGWNPLSPPASSFGDQPQEMAIPSTPVSASGGQNKTLPIVSLVCAILGCCGVGVLTGPIALITGFMGMKNANNDPSQYGGKGIAIAGLILGILVFLGSTIFWILYFLGIVTFGAYRSF